MKTTELTRNNHTVRTLAETCQACYRKLVTQLRKSKEAILAEFRQTLAADESMLRLAVNEAEALAWQTAYPQLVFPTLAMEKAQAVAAWDTRQRAIARETCGR